MKSITKTAVAIVVSAAFFAPFAHARDARPAPVKEIRPGILAGYLGFKELPNSLVLLPPPPAAGSPAESADAAYANATLALRDGPRWKLAIEDADLHFPKVAGTFSCSLGIAISDEETPYLYQLLRRTLADAGLSTYRAKDHYARQRPFMVNQKGMCTPAEEAELTKDGSYPSGHSAIGWAWGLILAQAAPENADALIARGRAYSESRSVCNVHWSSDITEGRNMGSAAVARLNSNAGFLADLAAAKEEIAAQRAKGSKPTRDCADEATALAVKPTPAK